MGVAIRPRGLTNSSDGSRIVIEIGMSSEKQEHILSAIGIADVAMRSRCHGFHLTT